MYQVFNMDLNQLQQQWRSHRERADSAAARGDWIWREYQREYHLNEAYRIFCLPGFSKSGNSRSQGMNYSNDSSPGNCNAAPIASFFSSGTGMETTASMAFFY
jgi:hypothetical protein